MSAAQEPRVAHAHARRAPVRSEQLHELYVTQVNEHRARLKAQESPRGGCSPQTEERRKGIQRMYDEQLRAIPEEQQGAPGGHSPEVKETLDRMADQPQLASTKDFFVAVYDLLPDRWTTFATLAELYALYQAMHRERQAGVLGVPPWHFTPQMAPCCGGGESVVDAVFAKAPRREARLLAE